MIDCIEISGESIPLSVPFLKGNEWKYIKECLDTGWISGEGKFVDKLENKVCQITGARYAIACVSATSALQVALRLVGVESGDEVIVSTVTFIASINTIKYLNAEPVFMDCDNYYNLDIVKTIRFIEQNTDFKDGVTWNRKTKNRISAIIVVHVFGNAVNLEKLLLICSERNIRIIEDAAESLGTFYCEGELRKRHTGTVGDFGVYSFNANKIITTGGGGIIVTNNAAYAKKAKYLTTQAKDDPIRYIHKEIGYNYRLNNLQAAVGVAQLERLLEYIKIKKINYWNYKNEIDKIPGLFLGEVPSYASSNYWFYCLQIDKSIYGKNREQLMRYLIENKVQTRPIWQLNHLQIPYINCQTYNITKAFELLEKTLNIPCSVNLTKENIEKVIRLLKNG